MTAPPFTYDGPNEAAVTFAFAHGAGVGMNSDFMDYFAAELGAAGLRVARFEFPYMQKRRADGKSARRTGRRCCWRPGMK